MHVFVLGRSHNTSNNGKITQTVDSSSLHHLMTIFGAQHNQVVCDGVFCDGVFIN